MCKRKTIDSLSLSKVTKPNPYQITIDGVMQEMFVEDNCCWKSRRL
jgi:hypothetical protein